MFENFAGVRVNETIRIIRSNGIKISNFYCTTVMKVSNAEIGSLERDREEIDRKIKAICEEILPGWSDLAENEFEVGR